MTKVFDVQSLVSDVAASADDDLDFIHEIPAAEVWRDCLSSCQL